MRVPPQIDAVDLAGEQFGTGGAYPSLGFVPVLDAELGNGDYFGFYWPYGRESDEPIVCDMLHDEWRLAVAFSTASIFVKWLELNDGTRGDIEVEDNRLVARRFREAKNTLKNETEAAVAELRQICDDFPESAEYWFALAGQLRRTGDHAGSHDAAIRAFASNWAFGMPPRGTLRMLQSAKGRVDDPVVDRSGDFSMKYGGAKENRDYVRLKECVSEYLASPNPIRGLLLNQNYGYMMLMETTAFQDRYQFDFTEWLAEHRQLCANHVGDSRSEMS